MREDRLTGSREERSLRGALHSFLREARSAPRDVLLVFLVTAVVGILSARFGSKRFFFDQWYDTIGRDPLYELYQYLYWFSSEFLVYFILLLLSVRFLHRAPLRQFGLGAGDWRFGLKISLLFYGIMLPVLWFASAAPAFQEVYPHARIVRGDWTLFLIYELAFILYFIGWEYIWRGYVLFGLLRHTGAVIAVLVQMLPFVIMHFGKPLPETFGSIAAGIALGALSVRTRSFWYAVLIHWSVMLTIDLLSTLRFRSGVNGIGPDALIDIFAALLR
ncbi:MAG: CPBP family intramembrane metalloprotease [Bacteroidetes bacterium]|nr:CPBP family intramembrane metalloprotease [Bacteroidota bacterium]